MTNEELIAEAREAAFDARMDGSSRGTWLDELADALEAATTPVTLITEWGYSEDGEQSVPIGQKRARRYVALFPDLVLTRRTVGPWEAAE